MAEIISDVHSEEDLKVVLDVLSQAEGGKWMPAEPGPEDLQQIAMEEAETIARPDVRLHKNQIGVAVVVDEQGHPVADLKAAWVPVQDDSSEAISLDFINEGRPSRRVETDEFGRVIDHNLHVVINQQLQRGKELGNKLAKTNLTRAEVRAKLEEEFGSSDRIACAILSGLMAWHKQRCRQDPALESEGKSVWREARESVLAMANNLSTFDS